MITQRQKRAGKQRGVIKPLTEEQIQLLDEIEFPWDLDGSGVANEMKWQKKYQELAEFYKIHGHQKVKTNSKLYHWMNNQRRRRSGKGGRSPLTEDQIQLLDEIEFRWH